MVIAERAQNERPIRSSKSCSVIALAIDLRTPLVLALLTHSPRQHQRHAEYLLQRRISVDPADDVARHPAEEGAQGLQRPIARLNCLAWE